MLEARQTAAAALLLLPGGLVVFFAAHAGGFYPDTVGLVAVGLAVILVVRVTLAEAPFEGSSRPLALASAALALYALWQLISSGWSDTPGRAIVEFDRTLLYVLALVLFGMVARTEERVRWVVRGLALAIAGVGTVAVITR